MPTGADLRLPQIRAMGETSRKDLWWLQPLLVFAGLSAFIVYSTWAAWQGEHYFAHAGNPTRSLSGAASVAHYLSPMYSPVLWDSWVIPAGRTAPAVSGHAWFGPWPEWLPKTILFVPLTGAFLILWIPGGFRFTCYYYRGAYYKSFWADPVSCSVGEPGFRGKRYRGERWFPLVLQNAHRYFLYLALAFLVVLSYDAVMAYRFTEAAGHATMPDYTHFPITRAGWGIAIGSLVLTVNPILLGGYTLGCHSLRHLVGGRRDRLSEHPASQKAYDCVSCLNRRHMLWAWLSLFWVGFTDLYVRMVSMGVWTDYRFI